MTARLTHQVTVLLQAWSQGEEGALEQLTGAVYRELKRPAHRYLGSERPAHTLQTTALVNEAYLRLIDGERVNWKDRAHFFAVSARLMRRILVDRARALGAKKRGEKLEQVTLDEALVVSADRRDDLVALDEALQRLGEMDARKARVIELRFFGGLSVEETAEVLKVSTDSVLRDWRLARLWLSRELGGGRQQ